MKYELSIIIKALNEEVNIERAIKSCIKETKGIKSEIILADSLSRDKTIEIAKKYPIKIVQLTNKKERSCGVGPQLGYQYSNGKYIYILDGDMELRPNFLKEAIKILEKEKQLAGIAGSVVEKRAVNIVFKRRKEEKTKNLEYTDKLEMGGLYKREAIESINYFSDRNLHAYEEAELGYRLIDKGWKLKRISTKSINHYGYNTTSFGVFKKRWKTRYVKGAGEFLRSSIGKKFFFKTVWHMKIYLSVILWWILLIASICLIRITPVIIEGFGILSIILLIMFLIKKRNLKEFAFSLVSWHYSSIGILWGLVTPQRNPKDNIPSKEIKK